MRILQVVDVLNWAIGGLAESIKQGNSHHTIEIIEIHPKDYRANPEKFNALLVEKVKRFSPDVIHFHYWDTAWHLAKIPELKGIKKMLTHHNQRNLNDHTWEDFDLLVTHTNKAKDMLVEAGCWNVEVIQHGIDIEKFKFNENYQGDVRTLGYVGRIVPWKGLYDILKAAKELDTEVIMQGRIDKADYWAKCSEYQDVMDLRFNTPPEEQVNVYHEMGCYVGNSCDNVEEGTLGLLEAMACGVPVVTTPSGEAADIIKHGVNGILVEFENYESLKRGIQFFMGMTLEEKNKMRQEAWDTVRHMSREVMARKYEKAYYSLAHKKDLVSVIIPTCNRVEYITNLLDAYEKQTYAPIELIVVVDNSFDSDYELTLTEWKNSHNLPLKWAYTENTGYGLAQARNTGIFMAGGNYILFNDDRFIPDPYAVQTFVANISKRKNLVAVWGDKGAGKRDFIENFFMIRRQHIAQAGMFNERINEYGGQSQEIRERLRKQGFDLVYESGAVAKAQFGTKSKTKRRYELFRTKLKLWLLQN